MTQPVPEGAHVTVCEVGLRDGLQIEKVEVPTGTKVEMANRLLASGIRHMQLTSFVSPKAVPQLADAEEVIAGIDRPEGTVISALVPNLRGAERAAKTKVDVVHTVVSASETHNLKNVNRTVDDLLREFEAVFETLGSAGIRVEGGIATAFGCPFEGVVPPEQVARIARRYQELGAGAVSFGDTTGMATPATVRSAIRAVREAAPGLDIHLHFHNTRGVGLACVMTGLAEGVTHYDASVGGLGGCPFAAGATGNISTEDSGLSAERIRLRHRHRPRRTDRRRALRSERSRPITAGPGDEGRSPPAPLRPRTDADGDRMSDQPLAGVRVIDLTRILSGPFCSMLLGDLGADVVKIESPGKGDHVRGQGAIIDGLSWYFASFNRNKRSLTLDLRSDQGRGVLERLLARADILTENFRPGVLDEMGLTETRLREINPDLIVVSVNGYGSTGPYRDRPAFDFIAQAMSGFMASNGTTETGPLRAAPPLTDLIAGLYAALGAVAALRGRERGGPGQRVEASMMMGMLSMLAYISAAQLATGRAPAPTGNDHPIASPYGLFHAADGDVAVAPSTAPILKRFLDAVGLGQLLSDARFDTNEKRVERRAELNALIDAAMQGETQAHWIDRLNAAGVPCGRVQTLAEVMDDPQVTAQEMVLSVEHPGHGDVRMTGFPVKLSATPCRLRVPARDLGADTNAVLAEAGYSPKEIADLREAKVL